MLTSLCRLSRSKNAVHWELSQGFLCSPLKLFDDNTYANVKCHYNITVFTMISQAAKVNPCAATAATVSMLAVILHFKESKFKKLVS